MRHPALSARLKLLLAPLIQAGWQRLPRKYLDVHDSNDVPVILQRSCMVLGVEHGKTRTSESLTLTPIAHRLLPAKDSFGFFDMVSEPIVVTSLFQLGRSDITTAFARAGLLDPTRFAVDGSAPDHFAALKRLYLTYVGHAAARSHGGTTLAVLRALDADDDFTALVRTLMTLAPNVVPDAVARTVAIGLTLDCWRNTELESLHAGSRTLTDVVMAKLNMRTTAQLLPYVTAKGVDWDAVSALLLDPERALDDGRTIETAVGVEHWPQLQASIAAKLEFWAHIEQLVGPEATLRLLSVLGSTDATQRWFGNNWWPAFVRPVMKHVEQTMPAALDPEADALGLIGYHMSVYEYPHELPDRYLAALIDPPDGTKGLRYATVPAVPLRALPTPDQVQHGAHDAKRTGRQSRSAA